MKVSRILILTALVLSVLLALASCNGDSGEGKDTTAEVVYYNVTFDSNGGSAVDGQKVANGGLASEPDVPEKAGYIFDGWTLDGEVWSFSSDKVTENITLKAKWIDAEAVYSYVSDGSTATVTGVKRNMSVMRIPTVINGLVVTAVGEGAFEDASEDISTVILPDMVVSVGKNAFKNSAGLSIKIEGALTSLGEGAFFGCEGLEAVTLGEGLAEIPYEVFAGCVSLKEIRLPSSVTLIDENAFEECEALVSVMMHNTLTKVESTAFRFCDKLAVVYYYGTEAQFDSISMASGNDSLKNAKLCLYSETRPEAGSKIEYWYLDEKGKVKIWK